LDRARRGNPSLARARGRRSGFRPRDGRDGFVVRGRQAAPRHGVAGDRGFHSVCGGTEWQSFGGAVGIGILKEAIDAARKSKRGGRGASLRDLVADIVGAAAGVAIVAAMDR
jgi:hypothetical protein